MGSSQSMWAITGNQPAQTGPGPPSYLAATNVGLLPGLEDLISLDNFKIDEKSTFGSSYKIHNSAGVVVYHAVHQSSSIFSNEWYREVFQVSDSQKVGALRVFNCLAGTNHHAEVLPGVIIAYVRIMKQTFCKPVFEILNEKGEDVLIATPLSGHTYKVYSQRGTYHIGGFCPRMTRGIKGTVPRDLDVRMKAAVLLTAAVVCRKRSKEQRN